MRKNRPLGRTGFTLVEILIVVAIIGMLLAIATPAFVNARASARAKACQANLREVLCAKERWAMDKNAASAATPTEGDLTPYYTHNRPICPGGGTYTIGALNILPVCSVGGVPGAVDAHTLP